MAQTTHPQKQEVRDYLRARSESREPPPSPDRIRELLGWKLLQPAKQYRR